MDNNAKEMDTRIQLPENGSLVLFFACKECALGLAWLFSFIFGSILFTFMDKKWIWSPKKKHFFPPLWIRNDVIDVVSLVYIFMLQTVVLLCA